MKRIGFIGLGIMGVPMVRNLCKAGMDVTIIENGHGNKEAIAELKEKASVPPRQPGKRPGIRMWSSLCSQTDAS